MAMSASACVYAALTASSSASYPAGTALPNGTCRRSWRERRGCMAAGLYRSAKVVIVIVWLCSSDRVCGRSGATSP
jgi:hypothetical protein